MGWRGWRGWRGWQGWQGSAGKVVWIGFVALGFFGGLQLQLQLQLGSTLVFTQTR